MTFSEDALFTVLPVSHVAEKNQVIPMTVTAYK